MKKLFEKLRAPGDEQRHWVFLKGKHLSVWYQRHAALALYFLGIVTKAFFIEVFPTMPDLGTTCFAALLTLAIGYLIEFIQYFKSDRDFDHLDAWVMLPFGMFTALIFDIIRFFFYH